VVRRIGSKGNMGRGCQDEHANEQGPARPKTLFVLQVAASAAVVKFWRFLSHKPLDSKTRPLGGYRCTESP
jgi:hypothetical protein